MEFSREGAFDFSRDVANRPRREERLGKFSITLKSSILSASSRILLGGDPARSRLAFLFYPRFHPSNSIRGAGSTEGKLINYESYSSIQ